MCVAINLADLLYIESEHLYNILINILIDKEAIGTSNTFEKLSYLQGDLHSYWYIDLSVVKVLDFLSITMIQ